MTTSQDVMIERFFETLISGHRAAARGLVADALREGVTPERLISELFWPTYEMIERLYRADQLSRLAHHFATRLLRVLVDQNAARLKAGPSRGRTVFALCGPRDSDELGSQMAVDLLEQSGFEVTFGGGAIPADEIMAQVHETRPDVLLLFCSGANDLPEIRQIIDSLREVGACPDLQIVVGGGVFNRAEGLAEEIGADIWAKNPLELVGLMVNQPSRRARDEQRTVGRYRRVRRDAA